VDLEQSIAIYERGQALKSIAKRLKDAEARIEKSPSPMATLGTAPGRGDALPP
jgi:exonuclease VII small subunit